MKRNQKTINIIKDTVRDLANGDQKDLELLRKVSQKLL